MRTLLAAATGVMATLLSMSGLATQTRAPIEVAKLGPQVGEKVPGFSLRDQDGAARTLQSVMSTSGAMIVFIRSADW
jgi:hypothetical protein